MVELDGDIDGTLSMKGDPAKPLLNGELALGFRDFLHAGDVCHVPF